MEKKKMNETPKLPGFPKAQKASAHTLKLKYNWSDEQLEWLDKFWVKIGTEMNMGLYVRPDVMRKMTTL